MRNLEPVALSDFWEECPGFFVFRGPKGIIQTLDLSPQYLCQATQQRPLVLSLYC